MTCIFYLREDNHTYDLMGSALTGYLCEGDNVTEEDRGGVEEFRLWHYSFLHLDDDLCGQQGT